VGGWSRGGARSRVGVTVKDRDVFEVGVCVRDRDKVSVRIKMSGIRSELR
jgi:hypothetical protein